MVNTFPRLCSNVFKYVIKCDLTDSLDDHGVHLVWTELQLVPRKTEKNKQTQVKNCFKMSMWIMCSEGLSGSDEC